eukprot:8947866-Pyramimonas_sp.AAC.1
MLGRSWGPLGPYGGHLRGLLGCLGPMLGASWTVLDRRESETTRTPKSDQNQMTINALCLTEPS